MRIRISKYMLITAAVFLVGGLAYAKTQKAKPADYINAKSEKVLEKAGKQNPVRMQAKLNKTQVKFIKPYKYQNGKVFHSLPLDSLGRAQGSHIQLSCSNLAKKKRSAYLTVKPSGWHNYKFKTIDAKTGKRETAWLFNRGHLVGYQFCGLNNDKLNLITQTTYLNQGSLTGMDDLNMNSQLYYENKLRNWLQMHSDYRLDYSVVPVYYKNELVPRQVKLTYVGYRANGEMVPISFHALNEKIKGKLTQVTLNNTSPQAKINYQTGMARVISK